MYGIKVYEADLWLAQLFEDKTMQFIPKGPRIMAWETEKEAQTFVDANDLYMISLKIVKI